jgi:predicted RNA binding protein YcfA (HicA-like mRNA interferase family)
MKSSEFIRILQQDGWIIERQKGSHIVFSHPVKKGFIVVPYHGVKDIGKGISSKLLKQAGLK